MAGIKYTLLVLCAITLLQNCLVIAHQSALKELQDRIDKLEREHAQERQALMDRVTNLENKLKPDMIDRTDKRFTEPDEPRQNNFVGFTAVASLDGAYFTDNIIQFEGLVSNYGEDYDPTTGIFTCEVTGYYLFSVAILSQPELLSNTALYVGDTAMFNLFSGDNLYDHASATGVHLCQAGQTVRVVALANSFVRGLGFSSFAGTLLEIAA